MSIEPQLSNLGKVLYKVYGKIVSVIKQAFYTPKRNYAPCNGKKQSAIAAPYAILIFDGFIAFLSIFISTHLRVGMDFLDYSPIYIIKNMLVFGLVSSSVFLWLQTYMSFWRYTSVDDLVPLFLSVLLSNIIFFPLMMLMNQEDFLPYSVLIINVFVLSFMLLAPRFVSRVLYNHRMNQIKKFSSQSESNKDYMCMPSVLLVGNTQSVEIFLREIVTNDDVEFNFNPVGILSTDPSDVGMAIRGIPILGEITQLGKVMKTLSMQGISPRQIILTEKNIPEHVKKFLINYTSNNNLLLIHVMHQYSFNKLSETE